jgi:UDPglucose--hexose-1-phosphate uridylyltransferase
MNTVDFSRSPHRRLNLLTGEWLLVSPHRALRPWQGQTENIGGDGRPEYDSTCYLCPGNQRARGEKNDTYDSTFVFTNDYSALLEHTPVVEACEENLLKSVSEPGICRVICFSPRHDLTIAQMEVAEIHGVVDLWHDQFKELSEKPEINYVQIFENKGAAMGCSNPHPHGQIWAQHHIPTEPGKELAQMQRYYSRHGRTLLQDYLAVELRQQKRIVCRNESFVALVPYWATWPFELLILATNHHPNLLTLSNQERTDLAAIIGEVTVKYDNLFHTEFPYSAGLHQAPTDLADHPEWDLHMHFYPPLLRSASVKKFMVGYELLCGPQRDITPESSAELLRNLSSVHYTLEEQSEIG